MGLSLKELTNTMISKQGYTITPQYRHFNDLTDLINDMYSVRNAVGSVCPGHSGTTYTGKLSLGDLNSAIVNIKGCNCYTVDRAVCDCLARTGGDLCDCNSRTKSCSCHSRSGSSSCICDSRDVSCDCQGRTTVAACTGDCLYCSCVSRTPDNTCIVCTCASRTWTGPCNCNSRTPACDCVSRSGSSSCDCNSRDVSCPCQSRTGTSVCTCDGRCSCQAVKEFS